MLAGISTACFYPEHTEDVLAKLCGLHPQCVEVFANCDYEMTPAFCRKLRAIADHAGIAISSLHPYTSAQETFLFFSAYDRRFTQGRDTYKRFYAAAAEMGAGSLVFHGAFSDAEIDMQRYCERYRTLTEDAKACGIELCHENVSRCVGRTRSFFRSLLDSLPDAGVVFDVKQAVRSGEDVMEFAAEIGANIRHVHISDHDGSRDCLPPGQGTFNIRDFLALIAKNGFDRSVVVELYRNNFDNIVEIEAGYQHLLRNISTFT